MRFLRGAMRFLNKTNLFFLFVWFCFLLGILFYVEGDLFSFFFALVFASFYGGFFFYSLETLFFKKEQALALVFLIIKWFLLLAVLLFATSQLSFSSFLIGIGMLPVFALLYFLELRKNYQKT